MALPQYFSLTNNMNNVTRGGHNVTIHLQRQVQFRIQNQVFILTL